MADRGYTQSPAPYSTDHIRNGSADSYDSPTARAIADMRSNTPAGPAPSLGRRTPFEQYPHGRSSPAPDSEYGRASPAPGSNGGYQAYNPNANPNPAQRSATTAPYQGQGPPQQYRSVTDPGRPVPQGDYFSNGPPLPSPQRTATGFSPYYPNGRQGTGDLASSGGGPARLASPALYLGNANGRSPSAFGPASGSMPNRR